MCTSEQPGGKLGDTLQKTLTWSDDSSASTACDRTALCLSDNGNSFFPAGASVLSELGFRQHITYPSAVHQFLSPNDNRLHGTAKAAWRASRVDHSDDVDSSVLLLHLLDQQTTQHSSHWFERNLLTLEEAQVPPN